MLLVLGSVLEDLFKFSEMTLSVPADVSPHSLYTCVHKYSHSHGLYHWTASGLRMAFFLGNMTQECIRYFIWVLNLVLLSPLKCIVTLYTSTCNNPRVGDWLYKFASVFY